MPVRNLRSRSSTIFIPPAVYSPYIKVTITDSDNVVYEVADTTSSSDTDNQLLNFSYTPTNTERMGNFSIELNNNEGQYLNKFVEGDVVQFYIDYVNGTTLRFRGTIDNVYYKMNDNSGFTCEIEGRQYPQVVDDVKIIQFDTTDVVECFKGWSEASAIQDTYGNYSNGILYNTGLRWSPENTLTVGTISTQVTQSYQNKSYMNIMTDIAKLVGIDFYIYYSSPDEEWHIRVFVAESITNTIDYVAQGINLKNVSRVGTDNTQRKNKVVVYGKEENNLPLFTTVKNATDITNSWTKTAIVNNSNLATMQAVAEWATKELAEQSNTDVSSTLSTYGILNIRPGEMVACSVPYCGMNGNYKINSFRVDLSSSGNLSTELTVQKWEKNLADLFKEAFDIEGAVKAYSNLNDMSYVLKLFFDIDEDSDWYSLTNCETTDAETLILSSGQTSGTLTTASTSTLTYGETTDNITKASIRIYANQYSNCTYQLSNNDGITWETVTPGVVHTFSSVGNKLRLKINLAQSNEGVSPEFDAIAVLFK